MKKEIVLCGRRKVFHPPQQRWISAFGESPPAL
jgi:hypothetical protein